MRLITLSLTCVTSRFSALSLAGIRSSSSLVLPKLLYPSLYFSLSSSLSTSLLSSSKLKMASSSISVSSSTPSTPTVVTNDPLNVIVTPSSSSLPSTSWDSTRIKGIVFDMDGTLTCAGAINFEAMRTRCNIPPGHDILAYIASLTDKEEQLRCHQIVEEEETLGLQRMMLAEGAYQLLYYIRHHKRLPQALLTRNNELAMHQTMQLLTHQHQQQQQSKKDDTLTVDQTTVHVSSPPHPSTSVAAFGSDFFSHMLSRSFIPCKPHPAPLHYLAERWNLSAHQLLMVGDSIDDMMCGKNAGSLTCLIGSDKSCPVYQKALPHADITISSLTELQSILHNTSSSSSG